MRCRFCRNKLNQVFADLGMTPLANSYLPSDKLHLIEPLYPLIAFVCDQCYLVQLEEFASPSDIFSDYAYFSSYSDSWLKHAKEYTDYMIERFNFSDISYIVEIASNDGYLLQNFSAQNIPVLGIEPAANIAIVAKEKGIPTVTKFFGQETASELATESKQADLLLGNNVLAHVPDINDFVSGMKILLKPGGIITMEFPHFLCLINENQFDTIYHEHFSYISFITVCTIFEANGLAIFDVHLLNTHGGSLRIFAKHHENKQQKIMPSVEELKNKEISNGLNDIDTYKNFSNKMNTIKWKFLDLLISIKSEGKKIVAYGAAAKGNTLLNYCGINIDFIEYVVDRNPFKQNKFMPGSHIPIHSPDKIMITKPDYVLILPWNIKNEIMSQMSYIKEWGGKFITAIPDIEVIN